MQTGKYPFGVSPKFEPKNKRHRRLFAGHEDAPFLTTTFTNAVWFVHRPAAMDAMLSPDQKLVLLSAEKDKYIVGRTPDDEIQRLEALNPAFYVPSDRWVYEDTMTAREQLEEIDRCIDGTRAVTEQVRARGDLTTRIIPLAKGWKPWHFERFRPLSRDYGFSYWAYDVTQYRSEPMILADVNRFINVIEPSRVLLIGRLSPSTLRKCPHEVVAATGVNQWLINSRDEDGNLCRDRFGQWAKGANEHLFSVQTTLGNYQEVSEFLEARREEYTNGDVNIHG